MTFLIFCVCDFDKARANFFGAGVGEEFSNQIKGVNTFLNEVFEDADLADNWVNFFGFTCKHFA